MSPALAVTPEMWSDVVERIATMEEALRRHDDRDEEMNRRQLEIHKSVKDIERFIAQINGGARLFIWLGGVLAAMGSVGAWLAAHIQIPWKS